jgi:hypothetical protein
MAELSFVAKSFVISLILIAVMQVKVGSSTIESSAQRWLASSTISASLQNVSKGAVLMIRNTTKMGTDFVAKTLGQESTSRAGRLNFNFNRSSRTDQENHSQAENNN